MMHPAGPGSMEEMQRKAEEAMREFRRKAGSLGNGKRAKAQFDMIPIDPEKLRECANQDCDSELIKILSIVVACSVVYQYVILEDLRGQLIPHFAKKSGFHSRVGLQKHIETVTVQV